MSEENIKREDYIDLPPLKKITIQLFRFVFAIVDQLYDVLRKNKLLLLIGVISGMAAGYFYYNSRTAYYEVSMIAESSTLYRKTLAEIIGNVNNLIITQSYGRLAKEFSISEQQARQINSIEMTSLLNESLEKDTSTKYNIPFKIIARIKKTELIDTFQNAVVSYLDNKPLLKKINEAQVRFYNEKLIFIDKELAKLDTLKTEYNRFLASSKITTTYYSNDVDLSNIYRQANLLYNEKGATQVWLSANSNLVQVIDEFKSPALPKSASRSKSMVGGSLIGLAICFLLGLYTDLYQKTRSYKV